MNNKLAPLAIALFLAGGSAAAQDGRFADYALQFDDGAAVAAPEANVLKTCNLLVSFPDPFGGVQQVAFDVAWVFNPRSFSLEPYHAEEASADCLDRPMPELPEYILQGGRYQGPDGYGDDHHDEPEGYGPHDDEREGDYYGPDRHGEGHHHGHEGPYGHGEGEYGPYEGEYAPHEGEYGPYEGEYGPHQGEYGPHEGEYGEHAPQPYPHGSDDEQWSDGEWDEEWDQEWGDDWDEEWDDETDSDDVDMTDSDSDDEQV